MGAMVAIGGGLIRTRGTAAIDREIIRLSGKKHPRLLFLPTASSDAERYWIQAGTILEVFSSASRMSST